MRDHHYLVKNTQFLKINECFCWITTQSPYGYDSNVTIINPSILVATMCELLSSIHHINLFNSEHITVFILYIDNS